MYYGRRENGDCIPLIPADELPSVLRLKNVKITLREDETDGMTCVGILDATSGRYEVAELTTPKHPIYQEQPSTTPYAMSPPASSEYLVADVPASRAQMPTLPVVVQLPISRADSSRLDNEAPLTTEPPLDTEASDVDDNAPASPAVTEVTSLHESALALTSLSSRHGSPQPAVVGQCPIADHDPPKPSMADRIPVLYESLPKLATATQAPMSRYISAKPPVSESRHAPSAADNHGDNITASDRPPVKLPAASSKFPNLKPGEKVYCTHWVRYGVCDFIQQGCKYRHEMPSSDVLKKITGMRDTPQWWKNKKLAQFERSLRRNKEVGTSRGMDTPTGRSVVKPASLARSQPPNKLRSKKSTVSSDKVTVSDSEIPRRPTAPAENRGRPLRSRPSHPAMEAVEVKKTDLMGSEPAGEQLLLIDFGPIAPAKAKAVNSGVHASSSDSRRASFKDAIAVQSPPPAHARRATIHAAGTDTSYFVPPTDNPALHLKRISTPQDSALDY